MPLFRTIRYPMIFTAFDPRTMSHPSYLCYSPFLCHRNSYPELNLFGRPRRKCIASMLAWTCESNTCMNLDSDYNDSPSYICVENNSSIHFQNWRKQVSFMSTCAELQAPPCLECMLTSFHEETALGLACAYRCVRIA